MKEAIKHTNIRVGPGVYLALKQLSENSGISMGALANFFIIAGLGANSGQMSGFSPEIQSALAADVMSALGDFFKAVGMEAVRNSSISELYQKLLKAER